MKKQLLKISASIVLLALVSITFAQHRAPVRVMEIPAAGEVTIDGFVDDVEGYSAEQSTVAFNTVGSTGADADFTFTYQVCWSPSFLYIMGTILDDTDDSTPDGGVTAPWTFDDCEVFIDLDTNGSGAGTAYDSNTIQLRVNRGMDLVQTFGRAPAEEYELYWENNSSGWLFEVAIPWKAVLATSEVTEDIMNFVSGVSGFDMSGADSDAEGGVPGTRDCQTAWDSENDPPTADADLAWNNRSVFGIVTFGGVDINPVTTSDATIYPNPTTGVITIENLSGVTSVEIMNLAGQVVLTADVNNNTVDMSQLSSGIYIANINGINVKVVKN